MTPAIEDWFSILVISLSAALFILAAVYVFRRRGKGRSRIHGMMGVAALIVLIVYTLYLANVLKMATGGGFWLVGALALFLSAALAEIIVDL